MSRRRLRDSPRLIPVITPPATCGQRIGLMGGTFNPPHAAHVQVAMTALRRLRLDRVWWLVSPGNPLKSNDGLPSLASRMAACRRLVPPRNIAVTGFEAGLRAPYTAEALAFLHQRHPGVHFVWIMGADGLAMFHRWRAWRGIAATTAMVVVDRPAWRLRALASTAGRHLARYRMPEARASLLPCATPPAWVYLTTRLSNLSSTELRAQAGHATRDRSSEAGQRSPEA